MNLKYSKTKLLIIAIIACLLSVMAGVLIARAEQRAQLIYLYSEVNEQTIYNTYLVDCDIDGDIVVDVAFVHGGGVYSTTVQCHWRITTPGTVSIAYIEIVGSGELIGPLTPVAINAPQPVERIIYMPMVMR